MRPREQRVHRTLGGGQFHPDWEEREMEPSAIPRPSQQSAEGAGLSDGIGPVDLERIRPEERSEDRPRGGDEDDTERRD
ncbi:MAG: hypothetical protein GF328_13615 [Candidatus Latescibacteria bacterium]|nr:hypothetical protein [Candidatus Latescibacterota bacterium]